MKLQYKMFGNKNRTSIVRDGGTPAETAVASVTRTPFPLGGYVYDVKIPGHAKHVYSGNQMTAALAAVAKVLA